ncbi:hypothetical protein G6F37_013197 [Rhizopus arrhizus]|nr:hypothetical protein G6F37_013197 [Rhizopus arrhizus]KAG1151103.1 hypothetical protein G6F38_001537 [Rhizopus arrhizus]
MSHTQNGQKGRPIGELRTRGAIVRCESVKLLNGLVLGIKVKLDNNSTGRHIPKQTLPDIIPVLEPKDKVLITEPSRSRFWTY